MFVSIIFLTDILFILDYFHFEFNDVINILSNKFFIFQINQCSIFNFLLINKNMIRKVKESEQDNNKTKKQEIRQIETILPKFAANWAENIHLNKIVVNISDCEYQVVKKAAKQLKFKTNNNQNATQWDVWWTDWAITPETLMKMQHHQKINHFPGMVVLSRKNLLAKGLMKMRKKFPQQYNFFPLTWNFPLQYPQFKAYYQTKPKGKSRTYIVKPQSQSQGKGIFLTRNIEDIDINSRCVVQRYISKPYLIDGLKFDLRIYVLLAGVDPLRVYIYKQGLARFATQPYVLPSKDNITDVYMHLTNYAINKQSQKFVFNEEQNNMTVGHKRSLTCIYNLLQQQGINVNILKQKINSLIVKTLITGYPHLKFLYRSCQPQNYKSDMCFQILGFDVLITDDLEPNLLEINYTPSFSTDTPLDLSIKKNLIKDTLMLMQVNKEAKQKNVKYRKQYRDTRITQGKQQKLTVAEKNLRRLESQQQRQEYINNHLGGFTKLYPPNKAQQDPYRQFINYLENPNPNAPQNISTRKKNSMQASQKQQTKPKLPQLQIKRQLSSTYKKANPNNSTYKNSQKNIIEKSLDKIDFLLFEKRRLYKKPEKTEIDSQDISISNLKNIKIKEMAINYKKIFQNRQCIIPKTIHFEGDYFGGISQPAIGLK